MVLKSKRSSTNLTKRMSRNSSSGLKRDRSSISGKERKSSIEETFPVQYQRFCMQFRSWIIPYVSVVPHEPSAGSFPEFADGEELPETAIKNVYAETFKDYEPLIPTVIVVCDEIHVVLHTVIFKNFYVDRSMLIALRKTFQNFSTIGILKLEHCQLQNSDLRTLKTILQRHEAITDLSINGNPNPYQNFYILLKDTRLRLLSMRLCQINDRGVSLIALQLNTPLEQTLMSLDLSSNFISDNGTDSLASALRINRTLLSLNLADNWLTDTGCITLINVLNTFTLRHEEIVIRRHRIIDFYKHKWQLIEQQKLKFLQRSSESVRQKPSNLSQKKHSKSSPARSSKENARKASKGHSSMSSVQKTQKKPSADVIDMQLVMQAVESELKPDDHPFVKNCYAENKEIYCRGNLQLINLNLSYNKITTESLHEIISMLQHQDLVCQMQEGLSNLTLEGNLFDEYCGEMNDIYGLIRKSQSRRSSNPSNDSRRSSKRKRSGLSRVSIIP